MKLQWMALALVAGCATGCTSTSPSVYSQHETMRLADVSEGVVVGVRPVEIAGDETPWVGAGIGAVAGGLAGNAISSGHGVGTVLGALAGGVGGAVIEKQVTKQQGVELTIRLDSGREVSITQPAGEDLRVGDRVRLATEDGRTRIERV